MSAGRPRNWAFLRILKHALKQPVDKTGFGRPPKETQFKPGQSGNPSGRPKSRKSFGSELLAELAETVVVDRGGRKQEMSNGRAIAKALVGAAIEGSPEAEELLERHISESQSFVESAVGRVLEKMLTTGEGGRAW